MEMSAPQAGMQQGPPQGMPPGMMPQGVPTKEQLNPLPPGPEAIKALRNLAECNIPEESKKLNQQLQMLLSIDGDHEVAELAMGKGIFAGLKMNLHCTKNLKTRTAVVMKSDDKLVAIEAGLKAAETEVTELQRKIQEISAKAQQLLKERWEYSVKTYGLNPEKNFYRIDEDNGLIEEIELRCDQCTAGKDMMNSRLTVEEYIKNTLDKEAANDGPGEEGSPEASGEETTSE